jgi:Mn-containing catalase
MKDTLNFLMTREVAHQKMFEAALASIEQNFPPGTLPGDEKLGHAYIADSGNFAESGENAGPTTEGFDLAQANSEWGFELDTEPVKHAATQEVQ